MSGNRGSVGTYTPRQHDRLLADANDRTAVADHERAISDRLETLARDLGQQNQALVRQRLEQIQDLLRDHLESRVDTMFGGSVSRHTYVAGLSDIDSLLLLSPTKFGEASPQRLLSEFEDVLRGIGLGTSVRSGDLAVTVSFPDGMELQLLPAIQTDSGVRIASPGRDTWSNVIHPDRFREQLTNVNQANQGKVIPAIRIIKDALSNHGLDIPGYHVEALAIGVFRNYGGSLTLKAMVEHFFGQASQRVKTRIGDITGQSPYVDEYLGNSNSAQRSDVSRKLSDISASLDDANSRHSVEGWMDSVGEG